MFGPKEITSPGTFEEVGSTPVSIFVVDSIFIVVDVSEEKLVVSEDEQSGDIPLHLL